MELVAIDADILVNPMQITTVERRESKNKVTVRVSMVDGKSYDVSVPPAEFVKACQRAGVDLGKQFFAV